MAGSEAVQVDLDLPLGGHLAGQLDREAVRVVELEGALAGDHSPRQQRRGWSTRSAGWPGTAPPPAATAGHEVVVAPQVRVGLAHDLDVASTRPA